MAEACLRGLSGEPDVYECSFVASNATDLPFFATKVRLGPGGAEEVLAVGDITDYEKGWLEKLIPSSRRPSTRASSSPTSRRTGGVPVERVVSLLLR